MSDSKIDGVVFKFSNGGLLNIARRAYDRALAPENEVPAENLLTGVVFSAIAAEAFINELGTMCRAYSQLPFRTEKLTSLGNALLELEDSHANTICKYEVAHLIVHGTACDRGMPPYSALPKLFGLRNMIVHHKAETSEDAQPNLIKYFGANGMILQVPKVFGGGIYDRFEPASTIRWAHNTVTACIHDLSVVIPEYMRHIHFSDAALI